MVMEMFSTNLTKVLKARFSEMLWGARRHGGHSRVLVVLVILPRRHGSITAHTGTTHTSILYDVRYREDDVHNVGFNFMRVDKSGVNLKCPVNYSVLLLLS